MFVNFPLFVRVFLCFGCLFVWCLVGWFALSSVCLGVLEYFFIRGDLRKRVLVPYLLAELFKHVLPFT